MPVKIYSEDASPNPEYLIKSIAEQGYSLETSLADLMDNSISANSNQIEVLIDTGSESFRLFLADNGDGMTEDELRDNMQFPSKSPDNDRMRTDLGRFGLGMKTASFSQTRKFTVLSKKKGEKSYSGRTWDVDFLRDNGWKIIVNSKEDIEELLEQYKSLSGSYLNGFDDYKASTIVIWYGLYKFENYLKEKNRSVSLKKEIDEVTADYLSLVFHRFMERENNPLQIRINNKRVIAFNPFPEYKKDFRQIEPRQSRFNSDVISIEGFVLPSRAISESKNNQTDWTTPKRGLMDMEGLYVYRADRIILFGGWNGIVKKAPRLQLARLRVEVGNKVDHFLHLNVAKSQIVIPHDLRTSFEDYINDLKLEAEREYFNTGIRKFSGNKKDNHKQLFERNYSNHGSLLELNTDFPIIELLQASFDKDQRSNFNVLMRMVNTRVNSIRHTHEDEDYVGVEDKDGLREDELINTISGLLSNGMSSDFIKEEILPHLGFKYSSLPSDVKLLLK